MRRIYCCWPWPWSPAEAKELLAHGMRLARCRVLQAASLTQPFVFMAHCWSGVLDSAAGVLASATAHGLVLQGVDKVRRPFKPQAALRAEVPELGGRALAPLSAHCGLAGRGVTGPVRRSVGSSRFRSQLAGLASLVPEAWEGRAGGRAPGPALLTAPPATRICVLQCV